MASFHGSPCKTPGCKGHRAGYAYGKKGGGQWGNNKKFQQRHENRIWLED